MKKTIALILSLLMILSAALVFALPAAAELDVDPEGDPVSMDWEEAPPVGVNIYGNGMENWVNSPNKGDFEAVTQILFCPTDWDGEHYVPGLEVTVNMKAVDDSSDDTFTTTVATVYNGGTWGICRIEPCLMEEQWAPVKDLHYVATFTFVAADGATVTCTCADEYFLDVDPIVPDRTTIWKYGNGMENWAGSPNKGDKDAVTQILFCPDPWVPDYYNTGLEVTVNMKATDDSSDDTFTTTVATRYNAGTWGILRLEPCLMENPWVPVKDVHYIATFTFVAASGQTLTITATDDDGNPDEYFLDVEPIVPGETDTDTDTDDDTDTDTDVALHPYANGMENWTGSPNKTDEYPLVTQILICVDPWDGSYYVPGLEMTITMKAVDGSSETTFTTQVVTVYDGGDWGICRFEPCLMDTPWIPVKDQHYYVTATFVAADGNTVTLQVTDWDDESVLSEYFLDVDPITPVVVPEILYGDVNKDGEVNKKDSLRLKQYLAGFEVECDEAAADVNNDGTVNKKDSLRLKQYLAGWDVAIGPQDVPEPQVG